MGYTSVRIYKIYDFTNYFHRTIPWRQLLAIGYTNIQIYKIYDFTNYFYKTGETVLLSNICFVRFLHFPHKFWKMKKHCNLTYIVKIFFMSFIKFISLLDNCISFVWNTYSCIFLIFLIDCMTFYIFLILSPSVICVVSIFFHFVTNFVIFFKCLNFYGQLYQYISL